MNKDVFKGIPEIVASRFKKITDKFIRLLAKKLKEIKGVDKNDIHAYSVILTDSSEIRKITNEITEESKRTTDELHGVFNAIAENAIDDSIDLIEYTGIRIQPYNENSMMQMVVQSMSFGAIQAIQNLSDTSSLRIRNVDKTGKQSMLTLEEAYRSTISQAFRAKSISVPDYDSMAMKLLKSISDSGIHYLDSKTGKSQQIDVIARNNALEGMRNVYQGVQSEIGKIIDMDGIEISAHSTCAPDHLPYQGRQYSNKDFEEIQNNLPRQFGMWNCRHTWKSIILGVTKPTYTEEQLRQMRNYSNEAIVINGKRMTRYEAMQYMNRVNARIKVSEEKMALAKIEGNDKARLREQAKITRYQNIFQDIQKKISGTGKLEFSPFIRKVVFHDDYQFAKDVYQFVNRKSIPERAAVYIDDKNRKYIYSSEINANEHPLNPTKLESLIESLPEYLRDEIETFEIIDRVSPRLSKAQIKDGYEIDFQTGHHIVYIWKSAKILPDNIFVEELVHDVAHSYDITIGERFGEERLSQSAFWINAMEADKLITNEWLSQEVKDANDFFRDEYKVRIEDFAEAVRMYEFERELLKRKFPNRYDTLSIVL